MRDDRVLDGRKQFLERTRAGFELVGEAEEARLLAARNKQPNKLAWRRRPVRGWPSRSVLAGPFGLIEVRKMEAYIVLRNDAPLYHATCRTGLGGRSASRFLNFDAAQAAAERHLWLGWSDYAREPDCVPFDWDEDNLLWLNGRTPRREPTLTRLAQPADVDDDHIFKPWEVIERSEPWGYPFRLASGEQPRLVKQISHLGVQRFQWRDFAGQPVWHRAAQGWFVLKTPRGELVVRRANDAGWIAELNGRALCYGCRADNLVNLKVVFDNYSDAQTLALLWLFAVGKENTLRWYDPPAMAAA